MAPIHRASATADIFMTAHPEPAAAEHAVPRSAAQDHFANRRTFAIISHPDAGKTTLTEKLLYASGAIRLAGHVKARGERRRTRSDWMEIEQKRGISVTSSVMTFEQDGITFNLLDTPGHQDFSEDTYRTLTAVDSAIMVIDAARGIESQTLKLFEVCRLRDIPIITFVNKIDREARDPLELIDEIAETLALDVTPAVWPVGMGVDFKGVLDLHEKRMLGADGQPNGLSWENDEELSAHEGWMANPAYAGAVENLELAREALPAFDLESYRAGHLTPIFFGSAIKSVGVAELLAAVSRWAPPPRTQPAEPGPVTPERDQVSGFVFKVQANMDKNHRDRIAFVRLCSGTFKRGMKLKNMRLGKDITVSNPMFFFAQDRETADEAVAGDVVGIPNHGTLSVGDTLTEKDDLKFTGIPNFAPEIIRRVRLSDAMKAKQLGRALTDLAEEGVAQVFRPMIGADWLVGVVGPLQLDVLGSRIEQEYGVEIRFEAANFDSARWVASEDKAELKRFLESNRIRLAEDRYGAPVFLAPSRWELQRTEKDWPKLVFQTTRERG
ncbi:Peptide chain release factor 3 [Lutibaculum baratangense AMV1]|uniref:Peptide chain release factor 3 n=2 Tax=Lutibaculum TaxID=1358438 RepID=V4R2S7_9HYPH|nr:Peptide chain release factor 3 [Lutibaculum baratangense AMV1]